MGSREWEIGTKKILPTSLSAIPTPEDRRNLERKNLLRTIEELRWDLWLVATAIGLTLFGVIMVYSASVGSRNPNAFLYGQIRWAALGLIVMLIVRRIDYHRPGRPGFVYGFLGVCVLLLLLVFLFPKVNNAHRWILFKGFSAQPSELALALVIFHGMVLVRTRARR